MGRLDKIKDIEYKIESIEKEIQELDQKYFKAYSPKGYKGATNYNDYDTIPGGNKELHMEEYYITREKLTTLMELNEQILLNLKQEVDEKEYLKLLTTNAQKVKFLRVVKGYTQVKTADLIGVSERTVRRIENIS